MADIFGITIAERCHILLADYLRPGDTAVDCTCGNGNDTLFLCRSVGTEGKVYAFDIQEQAIHNTRDLLEKEGCEAELLLSSHVHLRDLFQERVGLPEERDISCGRLAPSVIMYNLGYLPGGDHDCTTRSGETLESIRQALMLVKSGGIVSVVAYPGHREGREEAQAVSDLFSDLSAKDFEVITIKQTNRSILAPVLHLVLKR